MTCCRFRLFVVSYRNSTSNHNFCIFMPIPSALYLIEILHQTTTIITCHCQVFQLYLIEILHQTTTIPSTSRNSFRLYLIEILHQTTTLCGRSSETSGCILSKFYIKPQQRDTPSPPRMVVSYRNSTSNHNPDLRIC